MFLVPGAYGYLHAVMTRVAGFGILEVSWLATELWKGGFMAVGKHGSGGRSHNLRSVPSQSMR